MIGLTSASRKRVRDLIIVSILACNSACVSARPIVNSNCNILSYYDGLFQRDLSTWTRDEIEDLLRKTHSTAVPFIGSHPDSGLGEDVLTALLELDQATSSAEKDTISLFYPDQEVAKYPLDRTIWVPEHVCPLFLTEEMILVPTDFDWAYSDLHNIRPVHPSIHESGRGTQYFGVCPTCDELFEEGSDACICGDFFQPPPSARGVVARTWLYMQLRYPDLYISNCHLEQLISWHVLNPPTDEERRRNDIVCSEWQGNRNPFVDFQSLAWTIRVHETECDEDAWYGDGSTRNEDFIDIVSEIEVDDWSDMSDDEPDYEWLLPLDDNYNEGEATGDGIIVDSTAVDSNTESSEELCASLLAGDIFFYVLQAKPTRLGLIPLVDLPVGLGLYLTTSLSFEEGTTNTPLIELDVDDMIHKGSPFGFGRDFLMGDQWVIETLPPTLGGHEGGGDEVFLFCYSSSSQINLISAITTGGKFQEPDHPLLQNHFGSVVLPEAMDYHIYNGPSFTSQTDYQWALKSSTNWLSLDLPSSTTMDYVDAWRVNENQESNKTMSSQEVTTSGVGRVHLARAIVLSIAMVITNSLLSAIR